MPLNDDLIKKLTKNLQEYRHVLLNGTIAIQRSLHQIELRFQYMSEASDIFKKSLENCRNIIEDKADED